MLALALLSLFFFYVNFDSISIRAQERSAENERISRRNELKSESRSDLNMKSRIDLSDKLQKDKERNKKVDIKGELMKFKGSENCKPQDNILFLKTHKTGSSTITNILNRYADLRELSVAIPVAGDFRFDWPRRFHWSVVDLLRLDGEPANILCNHARYNRPEMDLIMQNDTKYITILRNPIAQFESAFYYFEYDRMLMLDKFENPLEEFLRDPDEHLYNLTMRDGDLPEQMNLIQSGMFYDLGLDFMDFDDEINVKKTIRRLHRDFNLVMITDYFDESLVLLKRRMCWDFDDVLYIKMNQRRITKRPNITIETEKKIREWNKADVLLYEYFNKTFWREIQSEGPSFWDDLEEFKRRNKYMSEVCDPMEIVTKGFQVQVEVKRKVMNPTVDRYHRYFCEKMLMTEVEYVSYFRKKLGLQYGYQGILIREGLKSLHRPGELKKRLLQRNKRLKFANMARTIRQQLFGKPKNLKFDTSNKNSTENINPLFPGSVPSAKIKGTLPGQTTTNQNTIGYISIVDKKEDENSALRKQQPQQPETTSPTQTLIIRKQSDTVSSAVPIDRPQEPKLTL